MNLQAFLETVLNILRSVLPLIVALGVVYFTWGIVQYVIGGSDEQRKKARGRIIYGIIALAIISSIWGIVNLVINTFGLGGVASPGYGATPGCRYGGLLNPGGQPILQHAVDYINCTIRDGLIPLIFAIALAAFIWGLVNYFIVNADEEAKRNQGKQFMLWGIIAITVMLCVWGLVRVLTNTFGIRVNTSSGIPQVKE